MPVKYISPFTDYGFKRLFGEEPSKDLLMDFLNELLGRQTGKITDLSYQPNESLPVIKDRRKAIFDIYCTNAAGEHFIIEMQKVEQKYFKDRMLFYASFPIQAQAKNKDANWNFNLKHVYAIGILDFAFDDENDDPHKYRYDAKITEVETGGVFYDKLTFTYLVMPKFNKKEEELETRFEKWLYLIKHLEQLDRIPEKLRGKIFEKFFKIAEIARLSSEEYRSYQSSLNVYRDMNNSLNWAEEKGRAEGRAEGREEEREQIAVNALKQGISEALIMQMTALTAEQIEKIKRKHNL